MLSPKAPKPRLLRDTTYNLATQLVLVALAIVCIPALVGGLGKDRFALLSVLWAFVGYFSMLDLGISRAITKYAAESVMREDEETTRRTTKAALVLSAMLGIVSAIILLVGTPFLLDRVLHIDRAMAGEVRSAFVYAAISIPFMLVFGTVRGLLMAFHRFDLANVLQGGMGSLQWIGAVVLVWAGGGLDSIILLTLVLRILACVATIPIVPTLVPGIGRTGALWDPPVIRKLLAFGGWVTVSQVVSPLFLYLDRILIGAFLTLTALAYYAVPQEAISRMLILPMSLTLTLFPTFSGGGADAGREGRLGSLYNRSVRLLFLIMLPIILIFIVYARDILLIWVGAEFAEKSTLTFQIITAGLFFNALAQVPVTALHAVGRPDICAKFQLMELPGMVALNLLLIPALGIIGAAVTWSARVTVDAYLMFRAARRYTRPLEQAGRRSAPVHRTAAALLFLLIASLQATIVHQFAVNVGITILSCAAYAVWAWLYTLDNTDRDLILQFRRKLLF